MLQSKETQRESCILRGFVCCRVKKHSVNHVFYEGLCAHLSGLLILVSSPRGSQKLPEAIFGILTGLKKRAFLYYNLIEKRPFSGLAGEGPRKAPRKANAPREVHGSLS